MRQTQDWTPIGGQYCAPFDNVMGLNPFHDFGALELARFVAGLQPESQRAYDFQAEMAAILAKIDSARHVELVAG